MPYACPRQQGYCIVRRQRHAGRPEECVAVSQRCGGALDRRRRADSSGAAWSSARRWPEGTDARLPPPPAFVPDPFPRVAAQLDSLSVSCAPRGAHLPEQQLQLPRARARRPGTRTRTPERAGRALLGSSAQTTMNECESLGPHVSAARPSPAEVAQTSSVPHWAAGNHHTPLPKPSPCLIKKPSPC